MRSIANTSVSDGGKRARHDSNHRNIVLVLICLLVCLIVFTVIALCVGAYGINPSDVVSILISKIMPLDQTWTDMENTVVTQVRLPRVLGALLVGAALAVAGCAYQSLFRNPLVSPDLLGVSSGACIGAAACILLSLGAAAIQIGAFVGGIIAVTTACTIPKLLRRESTVTLVLSGIIVAGFCGSIMGLLKYLADPETMLPDIVYWQMGSLAKVNYESLTYVAPIIILSIIVVLIMRWRINVLALGDHEARALGVNLKLERGIVICFATLLTASATCLAGTIGWIGLVMPHLARFIVGPNASRVIPVAGLMSASFMLVIDTLARITGAEIPLSILTGFIGTPFFILLLAKQRGVDR